MDQLGRDEVLHRMRAHLGVLAERFGVTSLALYGSFARDQATNTSDVDILAEFESAPDWKRFFGAQAYLEELLGRSVELVTIAEVRHEIRPYVERDAVNV